MRKTKLDVEIEKIDEQMRLLSAARAILVSCKGPSKAAAPKPKKAKKEPAPEVVE